MRTRSFKTGIAILAVAAGGALLASTVAVGQDEPETGTAETPRDVVITMTDALRFDPADIDVVAGETVRFVLENPTAAAHDFTLGSVEFQEQHEAEMAAGMAHEDEDAMAHEDEDEDAMAHEDGEGESGLPAPVVIPAGESVAVVATFEEPGEVLIGCHQPGHWPAGMKGTITVLPA